MAAPAQPHSAAPAARRAVTALFAANGLTFASVVPWFPAIKESLALSNGALGTAIAAMPLGALLTGVLAGRLISRFGSASTSLGAGVLCALAVPAVALAPNWGVLAAALFLLGSADAWMDSAMNAHGLRVQRRYGRSIINSFHATWSIAAASGGLLGAGAAGLGLPMPVHAAGVAVLVGGMLIYAMPRTLHGAEESERTEGNPAGAVVRVAPRAVALLAGLGLLLALAGAAEDAAASWGAVYMRTELETSALLAGLPFVACQALMTVARLGGDALTDRFGPVAVAACGTLLAAGGLGGALLWPSAGSTIAGFALCGLGVATLFPLGLSAAGEVPGVRSGDGVTIVAWLARVGFLGFPPMVGFIADASTLRVGLIAIPIAAVVAFLLTPTLRRRG